MKCNIQFYVVPSNPGMPMGASKAEGKCMTHNFPMPNVHTSEIEMCPLGRMEDATDKALEKISEALQTLQGPSAARPPK